MNKDGDIKVTDAVETVHVRPKRGPDSRNDAPTSSTVGASGLDGCASDKAHGVPQFVGASQMEGPAQGEAEAVTLMQHWNNTRRGWLTYIRTKDFWIVLALG